MSGVRISNDLNMKKFWLFTLLVLFLSGCSNNYTSGGNGISIRMKSGARNDYKLLFVRDNSLVVMDAKDDANENSFTHAEVIGFDSIYKVYRSNPQRSTYSIIGSSLLGGAIAGIAAMGFGLQHQHENLKGLDDMFAGMGFAAIGITGLSMLVSGLNNLQLHPIYPKDKELLREISSYPHGEPEMLKLVR